MIQKLIRNVVIALLLLVAGLVVPQRGDAQTFSVFHSFTDRQSAPGAGVIRDAAGNLYGTTQAGGLGGGTIYVLSPTGKDTLLYQFGPSPDGAAPGALMRSSDGNFYGATREGGAFGYGAIFKFGAAGERVLYSFTRGSDGAYPSLGALAEDAEGNFYGVTTDNNGTVFKLNSSGDLTTLYTFTGGSDGGGPDSGVILDAAGNIYGTAQFGGINFGVVFKISPTGTETVLVTFNGTNGKRPYAPLIRDTDGTFYSTTYAGGTYGCGTVFKINKYGEESVIYSFANVPDGCSPNLGVVRDAHGTLFGTTDAGGTSGGIGEGILFMLKSDGTETVLHNFGSSTGDGAYALSGELMLDPAGNLYGATLEGGAVCNCGTIYKVTP
jgi:uncharacterized repeat protein (TIGR03803 family)